MLAPSSSLLSLSLLFLCCILLGNGADALHLFNLNHHLDGGGGGSQQQEQDSAPGRFHLAPPARKHNSIRASIKKQASFSIKSGEQKTSALTATATDIIEARKLCATTQTSLNTYSKQ